MTDIVSFIEDLGLRELIAFELNGADDDSGYFSAAVEKYLAEINNNTKETVSIELIEVIQLTRRVIYKALEEKHEKRDIRQAQEAFDQKLKRGLENYLLEAEITNVANEVYMQCNGILANNESKAPITLDSQVLEIFFDIVKREFLFRSDLWESLLRDGKTLLFNDFAKRQLETVGFSVMNRLRDNPINTGIHKRFCADIFNNTPDATADKILSSSAEIPDIKKSLLVSFLRIILYPLKFIVDFLVRKITYPLHLSRFWKNTDEGPFDYYDTENAKRASLTKLTISGKTQQYAVFDFFNFSDGEKPPNGTIIFFHGNACDIHVKPLIDDYRSIGEGYRVIMMEYPGYKPSEGTASKQNISHVTHELFKDAKNKGLIQGDLIVIGDSLGSYYASLLAKKIEQEEPQSCKGLMLLGAFSSTRDTHIFSKVASYISDAEFLDTESILKDLPRTVSVKMLRGKFDFLFDKSHYEKNEATSSAYYVSGFSEIPGEFHNLSAKVIKFGLAELRCDIKKTKTLINGKKTFIAENVSKVNEKKGIEQQLTSH